MKLPKIVALIMVALLLLSTFMVGLGAGEEYPKMRLVPMYAVKDLTSISGRYLRGLWWNDYLIIVNTYAQPIDFDPSTGIIGISKYPPALPHPSYLLGRGNTFSVINVAKGKTLITRQISSEWEFYHLNIIDDKVEYISGYSDPYLYGIGVKVSGGYAGLYGWAKCCNPLPTYTSFYDVYAGKIILKNERGREYFVRDSLPIDGYYGLVTAPYYWPGFRFFDAGGNFYYVGRKMDALWKLPEEGILLMRNGSSYYILHYPSGFKEPAPIAGLTAIIGGKTPEGRVLVLSEKTLVDLITGKSWTIPVKGKVVLMDDARWLKRYGQVPYIAVKEVDYRGKIMGVYVVSLWRFPGVVYELENPDAKNWRYLSFSDNGMWAFNGTHIFAVVGKEEDPQVGPRIRLDSRFSFTSTIGFNNTTPITLHLPPTGEPPYLTEYLLKSINASIVYLETIPYTVDLAAPPVKEGNLYLMAVDPGGPFWMTPKVCLPGTSQCGEPGEFPEPPRLEPADEGVMIVGKGIIKYTYLPIQVPIGFGSGYLIYGPGLGGEYRPITLGEMDNIRIYGSFSPDFSYIHKSQQNVGFNFDTLFIIIPSAIGFTVARSAVIKKMIEDMRHVGTRVYELDPTKLDLVTDIYKGWLEWIYEAGDIGFKGRKITLVANLLPESAISEARPRVIGSTFTIKATVETPEKARNALERVKEVQEILQKKKVEIEKWWPTLLDNDPQIRALAERARDLKEAMEGVALSFKEGLITFDEATDSAMQILKEFKDDIIPALEKRVKELADIQKQSFFDKVRSALSKIEGAEVATSIADLMIDVSIDRAIGTAAAGAGVSAATAGVGAAGLTFLAINGIVAVLRWLEPFGLRLHGTEYGYVVAYELEVGGTKRVLLYGHTSDKAFGEAIGGHKPIKPKDIVRELVEDILLQDVQGDMEPHPMVIDKIEELPKLYTEPEVEAAAKEGKFDVLAQAIESRFQVQAKDVKGSVERLYYELDGEKLAEMLKAKPEEIKINRILLYSVYIPWSVTSWFINIEVPINVRERCSGFSILYTVGRHEVITDPNRQAEILNPSQITWIDDEGNARTETATWVPGKRGAELKFSFLDEAGKKGGIGFTITSKSKIPFAAKVKLDANLWVKSHLIPMNGTYSFQMEIPCDLGITMSFSKVELVDLPWKPGEIAFKVYAYDPDVGAFGDEYRFIKIPGDAFTWDWKESGWYGLADARRLPLVSLLTSCYKLGGEILDGAGAINTRVSVDFDSMSNPRYAKVCVYTTRPDAYAKLKAESWVEVYTQETNKTVIHGRAEERYEVAAGDWGETAAIGGREYYAKCFMMDIRALSAEARQIACQAGRPDVHLAAAVWLVESNYPGPEHDDHATASTLITCREGEADFCVLVLDAISKQPVQGARLSLANQTGHQWPEADTGSDGRYYYGKLPLGVYSLTAVKSGYEGFQGRISLDRDYPCSSPYAIELNRIETKVPINLDVLVVDGATNAPISGAAVSIYQDGALAASGQTGGDGIASFTLNSSIRYRIAVEKEGYAAQEKEFVSKKNATEIISLSSAPQLYNVTVKVLDGNTSTPIKGIKVSFRDGGVEFTEYTSDDGIARFKLPKEVYTLEVIDETGKYTSETRTVAVYQDMEITVILWPAAPAERQGYIILKVLDAVTKGPIAGASVAMKNRETGQILSGSTNSSGMVSFYAKEGWYYYNVTKEGYMSIRNAMRFFAVNIVYTEYLTPGAVSPAYLKVRVLDAETLSPIEGAYVTVENSTKSLTGVTAATGWANFTVAEGFYEITAFKQGYYASAVSAYVSGTFHVYLTLKAIEPQEKNFTVNVYVLNAVGATPIRGALVRLYSSNYNFTGSTDENGLAALENVPVGSYLLRVEKDGFVPFNTAVTISNNATIYVSMIPENIRPMHKLSVRVIDAGNGSALEGVLVKLKNGTMWFQAYTNSTGWAELILPEDNYWLTLSKSGYHTHMESIWIVNDMSIERMLSPLTASAYGDVVIKAVDLMTRAPIPGVAVTVTNESRPMFVQYTNSSGMAAFKLASGIYKIDLAHEEYAPKHVEAFLLPGRTYEFELVRRENITAMLRLEVVDAETGLPVAGARILLQNSTKRIIAVTGDDGGASMLVEKGLYEISVSHPKYYDFGPITYYVGGDQLLKLSLTPRYMCPPPPGSNWTEPVPCGGLYWLVVQVVYRDGVGFPGAAVKVYDALNQTEVAEMVTDGDGFARFLLPANDSFYVNVAADHPGTGASFRYSQAVRLSASTWKVVRLPWDSPYFAPEVWAKGIEIWAYKPLWNYTHLIIYEIWTNVEQDVTARIDIVDIDRNAVLASATVTRRLSVGTNVFYEQMSIVGSGIARVRPKLTITSYENDTNLENNVHWGEALVFRPYIDISVTLLVYVMDYGVPGVMYPEHTIMAISVELESTAELPGQKAALHINQTYRSSISMEWVTGITSKEFDVTRRSWINETARLPWAPTLTIEADVHYPFEDMTIDNRKSHVVVIPEALKLLNASLPSMISPGKKFNVTMYVLTNRPGEYVLQVLFNNDTLLSRVYELPEGVSAKTVEVTAPKMMFGFGMLTAFAGPDSWLGDNAIEQPVVVLWGMEWMLLLIIVIVCIIGAVVAYKAAKSSQAILGGKRRRALRDAFGEDGYEPRPYQAETGSRHRPEVEEKKRRILRSALALILALLLLSMALAPPAARAQSIPSYYESIGTLDAHQLVEGIIVGQGMKPPPHPEVVNVSVSGARWMLLGRAAEFRLTGITNETMAMWVDVERGIAYYNSTSGLEGSIYSAWSPPYPIEAVNDTRPTLKSIGFALAEVGLPQGSSAIVELAILQDGRPAYSKNATVTSSTAPQEIIYDDLEVPLGSGMISIGVSVHFTGRAAGFQYIGIGNVTASIEHLNFASERGIFVPLNVTYLPDEGAVGILPQRVAYEISFWMIPKTSLTWVSDESLRRANYTVSIFDGSGNLVSASPRDEKPALRAGENYTVAIAGETIVGFGDDDCGEATCQPSLGHLILLDSGRKSFINVEVHVEQAPRINATYPGLLAAASAGALYLEVKPSKVRMLITDVSAPFHKAYYDGEKDRLILAGGDPVKESAIAFKEKVAWNPSFKVGGKVPSPLEVGPGSTIELLNYSEPVSSGEARFELWDSSLGALVESLNWSSAREFKVPETAAPGLYSLVAMWRSDDRWAYAVSIHPLQVSAPGMPGALAYAALLAALAAAGASIPAIRSIAKRRRAE